MTTSVYPDISFSAEKEMRDGAVLQSMLPYAKVEIEGMMKAVVNNVMSAVQSGTLTPESAQQKWIEYVSYARLIQRFEQRVRVGQSQGQAQGTSLDFQASIGLKSNSIIGV